MWSISAPLFSTTAFAAFRERKKVRSSTRFRTAVYAARPPSALSCVARRSVPPNNTESVGTVVHGVEKCGGTTGSRQ